VTLSDVSAEQVRKQIPEVEKKVKISKLSASVPEVQPRSRANTKLVGPDVSKETEIVYQRFAPKHMGVYHMHRHAENVWLVIEGEMEAIIGGVRYFVRPGELIFMPSGVPHATGNPGDVDMLAVEIYAPPTEHFEPRDAYPADLPEHIEEASRD
jgi:mannose-6-phosphate isomerase-like protein (cupin superfamily)